MKRRFDPAHLELMDRPQPVSGELERDLRNLRQLNRYFGSHAVVLRFLRRWIGPGAHLRIVDLATGSGDIPRLIVDVSRKFVLVSDLRRGLFGTIGVYFLTALIFREEMTRYDGRLSTARAFSFTEMDELARQAAWRNFGHRKFHFARQAIWMEDAGTA